MMYRLLVECLEMFDVKITKVGLPRGRSLEKGVCV